MLRLVDYPQLRLVAWSRPADAWVDEEDALALYEANWRFIEPQELTPHESQLIERLIHEFGAGVLHV